MKTVVWGEWRVDLTTRQIMRDTDRAGASGAQAAPRSLSPKAVSVLRALAAAPDRRMSREALLDAVWPDVTVGEEVLTHAIAELRRAVGDDRRAPRYIATVHKYGYRLVASLAPSPATPESRAAARQRRLNPPANDPGSEPVSPRDPIPTDLDDYAQLLTATQLFEQSGRRNLHDAARLFGDLANRWPGAAAHAGLARSLTFLNLYYEPVETSIAGALQASEAAVRANWLSVDAQSARGLALAQAGKIHAARSHFQKAIQLRPDNAETHRLLGHASFNWGDLALSALMLEQAAQLQPDDFHTLMLAAKVRAGMGDVNTAKANVVKAIPRIEARLLAWPNDFRAQCGKARALVELGLTDAALALTDPLLRHSEPMDYYLACMLARVGETKLALDRLETCVETGWRNGVLLRQDPDFVTLRSEPRFRRLVTLLEAA